MMTPTPATPEMTDAEQDCPLCWQPLDGERFFHLACGQRENADAERD
jgi:hypothetical protein